MAENERQAKFQKGQTVYLGLAHDDLPAGTEATILTSYIYERDNTMRYRVSIEDREWVNMPENFFTETVPSVNQPASKFQVGDVVRISVLGRSWFSETETATVTAVHSEDELDIELDSGKRKDRLSTHWVTHVIQVGQAVVCPSKAAEIAKGTVTKMRVAANGVYEYLVEDGDEWGLVTESMVQPDRNSVAATGDKPKFKVGDVVSFILNWQCAEGRITAIDRSIYTVASPGGEYKMLEEDLAGAGECLIEIEPPAPEPQPKLDPIVFLQCKDLNEAQLQASHYLKLGYIYRDMKLVSHQDYPQPLIVVIMEREVKS